ncbi:hypothetical protein KKI23_03470 [Patescibacteria group bacterium]|nr:hypothetical protein [Patescibacteria group bacterium]
MFVGLLLWATIILAIGGQLGFIDNIDLIFHEAGHIIFHFFGDFISTLGGSLMQILIPLICFGYFLLRQQLFASSFCGWWLGQNLINVSVYIGDTRARELYLIGPPGATHDWYWLLNRMDKLAQDTQIANAVWWIGVIIMVASLLFALYAIWWHRQKIKQLDSQEI